MRYADPVNVFVQANLGCDSATLERFLQLEAHLAPEVEVVSAARTPGQCINFVMGLGGQMSGHLYGPHLYISVGLMGNNKNTDGGCILGQDNFSLQTVDRNRTILELIIYYFSPLVGLNGNECQGRNQRGLERDAVFLAIIKRVAVCRLTDPPISGRVFPRRYR